MQFNKILVAFAIIIGNAESYVVTTNNDHDVKKKVNYTFVPQLGGPDLAIATLIAEKERQKLKYEIVADVTDPPKHLPSNPISGESHKSFKDDTVGGLAGLIWGTTFAAAEVKQKKDELKDEIVHDIAGVELGTAQTVVAVKDIKHKVKDELVHDIAGVEPDTAQTVVAVKDIKHKVKDELVHDIAGVELDTAVAVIEAKEAEEEVKKVVEETVVEAESILQNIWEILRQIWHYMKHSTSSKASGENEGKNENDEIPMKTITTTAPHTVPVSPNH